MKANIHPKWNHQAKVTCSCGAVFATGSTSDDIVVDICSKCHPFFTGEQRFVDVQGRVEKFKSRMQAASGKVSKKKKKGDEDTVAEEAKTLKDLLEDEKTRIAKTE